MLIQYNVLDFHSPITKSENQGFTKINMLHVTVKLLIHIFNNIIGLWCQESETERPLLRERPRRPPAGDLRGVEAFFKKSSYCWKYADVSPPRPNCIKVLKDHLGL